MKLVYMHIVRRALMLMVSPIQSRLRFILHVRFASVLLFLLIFCLLVAAGVHDSFWVHACDVDQMNQILREQFVELYSMPILENVCLLNYSLHKSSSNLFIQLL
jgi:hypothetical protein